MGRVIATKIPINEIKVRSGRRDAAPEAVKRLADSIAENGLMNPITVDAGYNLIAGLHRLEAAKLLGWTEIECSILSVDSLHTELAEIDENLIRTNFSDLELAELLARRKKIYEALHPATVARNQPGHVSNYISSGDKLPSEDRPFSQDAAEKLGVSQRTVERQIQIGENLTPEAKKILKQGGKKITKQNLIKLSRLEPEQQEDAAEQLIRGDIKSVDEYEPLMKRGPDGELHTDNVALYVKEFIGHAGKILKMANWYARHQDYFCSNISSHQLETLEQQLEMTADVLRSFIQILRNPPAPTDGT